MFQLPLRETSPMVKQNATNVLIPSQLRKITYPSGVKGHAYLVITFVDPLSGGFDVLIDGNLSASVPPQQSALHIFSAVMVPLPQVQSRQEMHEVRIIPREPSDEIQGVLTVRVVCPGEEDCIV